MTGGTVESLLGPYGLVVGLLIAVGVLWRAERKATGDHVAALLIRIADLTKERDVALDGWRAQTAATQAVASAVEEDLRERASRRRMSDRGGDS